MKKILMLVVFMLSVSMNSNLLAADVNLVDLCKTGALAAVQSALTNGADVNAVAEGGKTALMSACESTSASTLAVVGVLLNSGADVNLKDTLGKTALDYAKNNTKYGQQLSTILTKAGAVASTVKTLKNSSATVSDLATSAATAAAIKVATSDQASTKEVVETAVQAAESTAAANQKQATETKTTSSEEGGFFNKIMSWFK